MYSHRPDRMVYVITALDPSSASMATTLARDFPTLVFSFTFTKYKVEEKVGTLSLASRTTTVSRTVVVLPKLLEAMRVQL